MEKLPDEWVDAIFMALRATYGVAFDRQFECPPGEDPTKFYANLKAWWRRDLAAAIRAPHTIRYALDHLPARVPNLIEFKALCWAAPPMPRQEQIGHDRRPADPERVAAEMAKMRKVQHESPKAWAYRLKEIDERGGRLTAAQRTMYRAALEGSPEEVSE